MLLTDLPNVGTSLASDLRLIGISQPDELLGRDPHAMYDTLCAVTGARHAQQAMVNTHSSRESSGK